MKKTQFTSMIMMAFFGIAIMIGLSTQAKGAQKVRVYSEASKGYVVMDRVEKDDRTWQTELTAEQYKIARQKGTEPAYSGTLWNHHGNGIYQCAMCGNDLFSSTSKYNAGTGWPSFWQPIAMANISLASDQTDGVLRTEILCSCCQSHLGHVFEDGPKPTGKRYCVNSAVLKFVAK